MIKKWMLSNFKSVRKSPLMEFAPLTIVSGANSSGKSTIIQSILMIAQTLSSPNSSRPLVLNGELVKLGYAEDVIHEGCESEQLSVDFEIDWMAQSKFNGGKRNQPSIQTSLAFNKSQENLSTSLDTSFVEISADGVRITVVPVHYEKVMGMFGSQAYDIRPEVLHDLKSHKFDFRYDISVRSEGQDFKPELSSSFCSLKHFLPSIQLEIFNAQEQNIREVLAEIALLLQNPRQIPSETVASVDFNSPIGRVVKELLMRSLVDYSRVRQRRLYENRRDRDAHREDRSVQEIEFLISMLSRITSLGDWIERTQNSANNLVRREISTEVERILTRKELLPPNYPGKKGIRVNQMHPEAMLVTGQISDFFTGYINYLGPLRDDPKMIFSLPPIPDVQDVGMKGEYTAAVLERFGRELDVICPLPARDGRFTSETKSMKLLEAVVLWLKHMDLVDDVITTDFAKMGVGLSIKSSGIKKTLDLTNVGVGVSQVLPILTMCLITPVGGTVLLEQPELHLHPKVQAILGDFFMGMAVCGVQCIVETHSDRIINRIRRRIAEDFRNHLMTLSRIYFLEKEGKESRFISVEPNEYGAIPRWPKGFFDEGPEESQLIAKAASMKREFLTKNKKIGGI